MSREGLIDPEDLPRRWTPSGILRDWWKPFRIAVRTLRRHSRWVIPAAVMVSIATVGVFEARTSFFEARILSSIGARLSYSLDSGPSPTIAFPSGGPFNEIRGYALLRGFQHRLTDEGFRVVAQARLSPELQRIIRWGISPPFREPAVSGLVVRGENNSVLFDARSRGSVFKTYDDIPPIVVKALLFIENRELDDSGAATRNPVVDWGRSSEAGLMYVGHKIGLPLPVEGGSTLATQIEKFRYADGGRTRSASPARAT